MQATVSGWRAAALDERYTLRRLCRSIMLWSSSCSLIPQPSAAPVGIRTRSGAFVQSRAGTDDQNGDKGADRSGGPGPRRWHQLPPSAARTAPRVGDDAGGAATRAVLHYETPGRPADLNHDVPSPAVTADEDIATSACRLAAVPPVPPNHHQATVQPSGRKNRISRPAATTHSKETS
jgi:hypothetical protein